MPISKKKQLTKTLQRINILLAELSAQKDEATMEAIQQELEIAKVQADELKIDAEQEEDNEYAQAVEEQEAQEEATEQQQDAIAAAFDSTQRPGMDEGNYYTQQPNILLDIPKKVQDQDVNNLGKNYENDLDNPKIEESRDLSSLLKCANDSSKLSDENMYSKSIRSVPTPTFFSRSKEEEDDLLAEQAYQTSLHQ